MNILLIDKHLLSLNNLAFFLSKQSDISILDKLPNGASGFQRYTELGGSVDIVLLEIKLPDMSGLNLIQMIRESNPQQKIATLTSERNPTVVIQALSLGILGFFSRFIEVDLLLLFLREIMKGNLCISPDIAFLLREEIKHWHLPISLTLDPVEEQLFETFSNRELEVLNMLCLGLSNRHIASKLYISENTVKNHLHNVYNKLGISNRTQAVATVTQDKNSQLYNMVMRPHQKT
jgi:DNA-binding NarL/FixJ family response regulator